MSDESSFMKTIHLIAGFIHLDNPFTPFRLGDILEMRPAIFGRINTNLGYGGNQSILDEVTHVTAFIGIDNGKLIFLFCLTNSVNEALVKFSLKISQRFKVYIVSRRS